MPGLSNGERNRSAASCKKLAPCASTLKRNVQTRHRLSAAAHPAEAGWRDGQPQEAVPALSRGAAERATARRSQARAGNTRADDAAARVQPALEPGLRLRRAGGRAAVPRAGGSRRLHTRMPGARRGHIAVRRARRARSWRRSLASVVAQG
jgi:hypothetical protein